ncbi:MAG: NAD(P)/FAD-dependent oxidoreductase [Candidatus Tyrphobacter sp.]
MNATTPRVLILGGGFAGIAVASRLERLLRPREASVALVSRENFSIFTPMLAEVCAGALEVRHVVTPVRSQLRRSSVYLADVESIDADARSVTIRHALTGERESLGYEHLVIALGSMTSTFGIPGVREHTFALKSLEDAARLRNRLVWILEAADETQDPSMRRRLLTVAIVGGGFTGVEAAGEIVELFRSVLRFYPRIVPGDVKVLLVEASAALLAGLPPRMGRYAAGNLSSRGVDVIVGDGVASVDARGLALASTRRIESATVVWSAGIAPAPAIAQAQLPRTKRGAIEVGADLRVEGFPNVWALGDCAAVPNGRGGTYPATAQHAIREGPHVAENIAAAVRGEPTAPFRFTALGMMASLGARRAVAQLPGDFVLTGFLAWFLWRTYYLARLPGLDRKVRVAFDWTLDLIFARDVAEFGIYRRGEP